MAASPQASPKHIVPRRLRGRINPLRAGAIALLIIVVGTWLAFTKSLPWHDPYQFHAVFQTSNNLRLDSPVRIAGVNVGEVVAVEREEDSDLVKVTMEMKDAGLPLHKDATLKIRSRIFLEGNFFVDLTPGTPEGDELEDGDTIPVTRTSTPVQLDELLTALQTNDRESLQDLLNGLGDGLNGKPTAADDRDQDPSVRGEIGGQVAERLHRPRARLAEGLVAGQPGPARHRAARPLEADRRSRQDHDRARHQRGAAEEPDHELQPLLRALRRRGAEPERGDPPAGADRRERAQLAQEPERGAARARGLRARHHARRA